MLRPIVICTSCGACLGHIYMQFRELRNKLVKEKTNGEYTEYKYTVTEHTEINLDEIFEELGVPNYKVCCRGLLNQNMILADLGF